MNPSKAEAITLAIGGIWFPAGYGNSPCPAHGNQSLALTIKDDPTKRAGIFVRCHAGCSFRAVLAALESKSLIDGNSGPAPVIDPEVMRKRKQEQEDRRRAAQRTAQWLWDKANPKPSPFTVPRYLLARGISLRCGLPPALRFLNDAKHNGTQITLPAMVAAITAPDGNHIATHLTFLNMTCSGKTVLEPDKIIVGSPSGGAVRLSAVPADGTIGLAEGIESALSAAEMHSMPVWSAANTSVMGAFIPPEGIRRVVIFADRDKLNKAGYRAGQRAAEKLARRLTGCSIDWEIRYPGEGVNDFNDELARKRRERAA
jgi:putative DNA primase/helicase